MGSSSTIEAKQLQQTATDVSTSFLKYKTCVLKVSLHCKGCAKSVTKILKDVDGVYFTEVDFVHQTVTVCGKMEVETLKKVLKKKTSKHVEVLKQEEPKSNPKEEILSSKVKIKEELSKENQVKIEDKRKGKQVMKEQVVEVVKKCDASNNRMKQFEVGDCSHSTKNSEKGNAKAESKEPETENLPEKSPPVAEKPSVANVKSANVKIAEEKPCEPITGSVKSPLHPQPHKVPYHAAHPSTSYSDEPIFRATTTYANWGNTLGSDAHQTYSQSDYSYSVSISAETFAFFSDDNTNACNVM